MFSNFNFSKIPNIYQFFFAGFTIPVFFYVILEFNWFLDRQASFYANEKSNVISRIEFLNSIPMDNGENRKIFSGNLSSFLNESSKSFDVIIDRTQPLPDGNISVLINQVRFLDLYNWIISISKNGIDIDQLNLRKGSKDFISAQIILVSD